MWRNSKIDPKITLTSTAKAQAVMAPAVVRLAIAPTGRIDHAGEAGSAGGGKATEFTDNCKDFLLEYRSPHASGSTVFSVARSQLFVIGQD